ncbi:MAG: CotH kinase family protein [Deltaproteobacteria bacterium]|nr:CotH kinase family protein [Deltaproteobacteria bacterium]
MRRFFYLFIAVSIIGCSHSAADQADGGAKADLTRADGAQDDGGPAADAGAGRICSGLFTVRDANGKPITAKETRGVEYLFDPTKLHQLQIDVAAQDWAWLKAHARDESYVPAVVVFEQRRYEGAAVRFKGGWTTMSACFDESGKQICAKLSLKLRFNKYDSCGRFFGQRRLVLNSSVRDPSLMRERLAYDIARRAGVPAGRTSHVTVKLPDQPTGVYLLVEAIDKEFLEDRFADAEGNLYKQVWPIHETAEPYLAALRTNEALGQVQEMIDFAKALKASDEASFSTAMSAWIDVAQIARLMAVSRVISSDDGPDHFYCWDGVCENANFYFYRQPAGRFTLLPWDLDNTLWDVEPNFAWDWWRKPASCAAVSLCEFDQISDCTGEIAAQTLIPPQCDSLLGMSVRQAKEAYQQTLSALVGLLRKAASDQTAFRALIRSAVGADPAAPKLSDFDAYNDWLASVLLKQADTVEASLK